MTQPKKNSIISGSTTAVIIGLIVLICALTGLYPPDPPIAEEGVEVNLGNSDMGFGTNPIPDVSSPSNPSYSRPTAEDDVATQSSEESVSLNANKNATNKAPKRQIEAKPDAPKEPAINSNALFKRKTNNSNGGSQGVTSGNGNQGKEGGDPNSNRYDGEPGHGGAGFSLAGRDAVALPWPKYNSNKQGKIIVKIWVDRNGKVVNCSAPEKGSTIVDAGMVNRAKQAAMKARFSQSSNAMEEQVGTITYVFKAQ